MLTEVMGKDSVQRLKGILKNRYGMGLTVTSMIDAKNMDLQNMKSELRGGTLHVPICARGKYLATAKMSGAASLTEGDVQTISDIVQLVLEPALFSLYLDRQEGNAKTDSSGAASKIENVLQMEIPDRNENMGWRRDRPEFNSSLLLLESTNMQTISRVAVHLHETGDRWALLRLRDVKENFRSVQDLRALGPMTLIIEDLQDLNADEQMVLAEFAQETVPAAEPLILIGCTTPFHELISRTQICKELVEELMVSRIDLDRMPKDFSQLREALELLLDQRAILN